MRTERLLSFLAGWAFSLYSISKVPNALAASWDLAADGGDLLIPLICAEDAFARLATDIRAAPWRCFVAFLVGGMTERQYSFSVLLAVLGTFCISWRISAINRSSGSSGVAKRAGRAVDIILTEGC